ncbi:MAG TPA: hypothetical protein VE978_27130 [Chitinophagales bacterium]|nr:hypothetical protein [Chitinophagales bacterium]
MIKKENRAVLFLLLFYYIVMMTLAFVAKGTGDDGDSVFHFLFAKYAFQHPDNFLNQWAKPLYVLFAAPFAQFGFTGIKIFNVTVTTLTIYFSYRSAKLLRLSNAWFVVVALCSSPMYIHLSLSGLTEPLFALALIIVIFLALKEKHLAAALLVSFLPFFRSEGLIILCVYVLYLIFKKNWKLIPLLAIGHLVLGLIAFLSFKDWLWLFDAMPYAMLQSGYGSGSPLVFVNRMPEYLGWGLVILFCMGTLSGILRFVPDFFRKQKIFSQEELWLVYGSFFSVWIGHMIFWNFGIFHSYGLTRVLIGVVPCAGIICARGLNGILNAIKIFSSQKIQRVSVGFIVMAVMIASLFELDWCRDFDLNGSESALERAAAKYKDQFRESRMYYRATYVSVAFGTDIFDPAHRRLTEQINSDNPIPQNSVVIWDDYYSSFESKVSLNSLMVDERLSLLDTFKSKDCFGSDRTVALFRYNGPATIKWMVKDTLFIEHFDAKNFYGRDSSLSFSGKYCCRVDDHQQYSPGLDAPLNQLNLSLPATLQLSIKGLVHDIKADQWKQGVVVVSLDHEGKIYFWQGLEMNNSLPKKNTWTSISFRIKLPAATAPDDHLKIYIWNPHPVSIYVDDLLVEVLQGEGRN